MHAAKRRRTVARTWLALVLAATSGVFARSNLYEWIAIAPVVAAGTVEHDDGRHVAVRLTRVFRGNAVDGELVRVDLKRANREREESRDALRLEASKRYLLLLKRDSRRTGEAPPLFELVRGIVGARPLPEEGEAPWIDAVARFADVQALHDEFASWREFRGMLEGTNPVLVETALDLFVKFRRGTPDLVPILVPLFDHPRPDVRTRTARLVAQIAEVPGGADALAATGTWQTLFGRARSDPSPDVRAAAARAIGAIPGTASSEVLREIARSDPEQSVRYEAEKILYEWRERDPVPPPP